MRGARRRGLSAEASAGGEPGAHRRQPHRLCAEAAPIEARPSLLRLRKLCALSSPRVRSLEGRLRAPHRQTPACGARQRCGDLLRPPLQLVGYRLAPELLPLGLPLCCNIKQRPADGLQLALEVDQALRAMPLVLNPVGCVGMLVQDHRVESLHPLVQGKLVLAPCGPPIRPSLREVNLCQVFHVSHSPGPLHILRNEAHHALPARGLCIELRVVRRAPPALPVVLAFRCGFRTGLLQGRLPRGPA
mmetsp:Transcript_32006/g.92238  ORF Transcript_32006/g.92238 Transcript_32006/m.92238 type:complete len:246 (-) Transcript_32006:1215-1952(-)